jgi:aspartyl/asparaginyl-tRNA synthetase
VGIPQREEIELYGWIHEIRDTARFLFIIIRDVTGKAQITINKDQEEIAKIGEKLHHEDVIYVKGVVKKIRNSKIRLRNSSKRNKSNFQSKTSISFRCC